MKVDDSSTSGKHFENLEFWHKGLLLGGTRYLLLTSPGHYFCSALLWVGVAKILGAFEVTETQLWFLVTGWFEDVLRHPLFALFNFA